MSADFKSTVFLPQTAFPMKGELPKREPEWLALWEKTGLYAKLRAKPAPRGKFILHDGPPYANGHLHIGHALNKILKDMVNRSRQMMGFDAHYVPGWDCHGLPIEWKIEESYRAKGQDKDQVPVLEFRRECRDFAANWVNIQREEFKRLGVMGDWDRSYTTMAFGAEAKIVSELGEFLLNGGLYRGAKPVMWSVIEKTALAEAEVEYHDHTSTQVWVRFPIAAHHGKTAELDGASVVIWTTTPWTLPGNRAIAYGSDMAYRVYEIEAVAEGSLARPEEKIVLAEALAEQAMRAAKVSAFAAISEPLELEGIVCHHPLYRQGHDFPVRLLTGDFVTADTGTGFVHIAPGHGEDDWKLASAYGIAVPETVLPDGRYAESVPLFAGLSVLAAGKDGKYYSPAEKPILKALEEAGALLAKAKLVHSYPHSWRSKAPLIFRTTPQWFISMEKNDLRAKALAAIEHTRWVPPQGKNRIDSMVETRPDWCVSRQRAWGVPIAIFVHKKTGEVLRDESVMSRVTAAFEKEGADAWFTGDPRRFLARDHNPDDFDPIADILDVWFDSGCTHAFVLKDNPDLKWPASLYLEGSDQHRGWFQSSLLESCGTRGRAPYDAVLTHGFVLDEQGRKMSKSAGNVTAPQEVVEKLGADILRLWVASSDYSDDLRIGPEILKSQTDVYRRLRNTLRYLLGALHGFSESECLAVSEMPELERYILHRLHELDALMRKSFEDFDFHGLFMALHNFCAVDLSAFYFDVRKDSLYCDRPDSTRRRATRTVLDTLFSCLTAWLAPVLCFTAEEAWTSRFPNGDSVHLRTFPDIPKEWENKELAAKWETIRELRRVVTGALELDRANKKIGSSLQAHPTVFASQDFRNASSGLDLAEIAITSSASLRESEKAAPPAETFTLPDVPGVAVTVALAEGEKCVRCWRVLPEVNNSPDHLCNRCTDAVAYYNAQGAAHNAPHNAKEPA
ncbi:MAG: isoleucine--tRNA ligase [Alphaproteobacteria bacterium]